MRRSAENDGNKLKAMIIITNERMRIKRKKRSKRRENSNGV